MSYKPVQIAFERHQDLKNSQKIVPVVGTSTAKSLKPISADVMAKSKSCEDLDTTQIGKRGAPSEKESISSDVVKKKCRAILNRKSVSVKSSHKTDCNNSEGLGLRRSARLTIKQ